MFSTTHAAAKHGMRQSAPQCRLNHVALAVASAVLAMPALAQTVTTLPEVKVTAAATDKDEFITQARKASVGKSSASIQDTPFSVDVIDAKQASEMGAYNIEGALLYTAGVYAGRYGFDTRGDWAGIRGLTPSAYLDGLRSSYGFYNNVRPELYTLESIEVLKGPASTLYGQAELGGIINATSKLPKSTAAREVEVQVGSNDRKQIALDVTGPVNEDKTLLYRMVALTRNSNTQVDYVNDDAVVLMPSLSWRPTTDTNVTVLYTYQENKSKVSSQFLPAIGTLFDGPQGKIPTSRFAGEPGWDRYDTKKNELALFADQRLNEAWKVKANLRKTNSSSITREIYTTTNAVLDAAGNISRTITTADRATDVVASDIRLEGDLRLGPTRHQVTLGFDYQNALWKEWNYLSATLPGTFNVYSPVYGTVNTSALTSADTADNKIVQSGFYITDHMEIGPVVVSAALRRDNASNQVIGGATPGTAKNQATTGQAGVMYRFANGISPYISYSEAFVPNLGTDGSGGYLKPTTGTQDEAGVKYLSPTGNTSLAFAWFDIMQQNRVSNGAMPGGLEQAQAAINGWEINAKQRLGALELLGNYTDMSATNPTTQKRLSSVAEKAASVWAQYHFAGGWRAGIGSRYTGNVTGNLGMPVAPSVVQYDAMIGYTVGKWDWRLNVQNLTDEEYVSWCRGPATLTSTVLRDCGYGARRNVMLTANFKF